MQYEVFSPAFDAYLSPTPCCDKETADRLADQLRLVSGAKFGTSCDWQVREAVEQAVVKADTARPIAPMAVKRLMAEHGHDAIVVLAWGRAEPVVHMTAAGIDIHYGEQASAVGEALVNALGTDPEQRK